MLTNLSGLNRTRRTAVSPKVLEQRAVYADLAKRALFRAYPSRRGFTAELCILDAGEALELFWSILDLGGPAPGGWHQVHDLKVAFERAADGARVEVPLTGHVAGFHAWYRMRGGMVPVLPCSLYFALAAGEWNVLVEGALQDARPLCLFADAFHDLFHYAAIQDYYERAKAPMLERHFVSEEDPCPREPFRLCAGVLRLDAPRPGPVAYRQANRLHQVAVSYADVACVPVPPVKPPPATPLDPVNHLGDRLRRLHAQSVRYNHCPYDTCNGWANPPDFTRTHFTVNERTAYFHIEALAPLYRATGDPAIYRSARKWYEWIARNIWPAPGGGTQIVCGDRTVWGSALQMGGMSDAVCTFAAIDGDPRWVAPIREGLRDWPMHPTLPRPLMDQDAWGNEEMNTTGTYNMCTHFALACWRAGHLLGDDALKAKAEFILDRYTFPGERDGVWPYRPGNFPSHHYDMYLKWQLARLLLTGAPRWTQDAAFLARLRRGIDANLRLYAKLENGERLFWDWTHSPAATHPANAARHGCIQLETLLAAVLHIDAGYLEPLTQTLRGLYRLLRLPEVDPCWHGCWFHCHGNLLSLALHGFHVEGRTLADMRLVR
ncbi:MAG: hypothetical protein BWZ02_02961 [Lentisphaerae bacterium ADurb.BinA184]|nr:MAG: hypothetical protein BWZ02_02961 [Lentisphaerae bacterium ADurb.BinA184]